MTMFQNTDIGNAERLDALHGMNLRYVPAWNRWLVWDGKRWAVDDMRRVRELARDTIRNIVNDALATADLDERNKVLTWAKRSESDAAIAAMLRAADTLPSFKIAPDALDAKPYLVSCANGTLDLRLGILQPHRREDYITKLIPIAYDADAKSKRWLRWLLESGSGGDCDLIDYVRRAVGYSLTGDTGEQVFFFTHPTAIGRQEHVPLPCWPRSRARTRSRPRSISCWSGAAAAPRNPVDVAGKATHHHGGGGGRGPDIGRTNSEAVFDRARLIFFHALPRGVQFQAHLQALDRPQPQAIDEGGSARRRRFGDMFRWIPFVNVVPPERGAIKDMKKPCSSARTEGGDLRVGRRRSGRMARGRGPESPGGRDPRHRGVPHGIRHPRPVHR